MNARHTPGPWVVQKSNGLHDGQHDFAIHATKAKVLAEAFGRDSNGNIISAEANARLIAAAPDLLKALKGFVSNSSVVIGLPHAARAARAAIAKAEGRSNG